MIASAGAAVTDPTLYQRRGAIREHWPGMLPDGNEQAVNTAGAPVTDRTITLTEDELEDLIEKAVSRALRDVGIIATDDLSLERRRRDFAFLSDLRQAKESAAGKFVAAMITVIVGGFCVILVAGFRTWVK